jgi:hypothetical protein
MLYASSVAVSTKVTISRERRQSGGITLCSTREICGKCRIERIHVVPGIHKKDCRISAVVRDKRQAKYLRIRFLPDEKQGDHHLGRKA